MGYILRDKEQRVQKGNSVDFRNIQVQSHASYCEIKTLSWDLPEITRVRKNKEGNFFYEAQIISMYHVYF